MNSPHGITTQKTNISNNNGHFMWRLYAEVTGFGIHRLPLFSWFVWLPWLLWSPLLPEETPHEEYPSSCATMWWNHSYNFFPHFNCLPWNVMWQLVDEDSLWTLNTNHEPPCEFYFLLYNCICRTVCGVQTVRLLRILIPIIWSGRYAHTGCYFNLWQLVSLY
jgi:hypothetical protein